MNCDSVVKLIPLYYYGELAPDEEDRVEQHIDGCAACARGAERHRSLASALERHEMRPSAALLAECRHDLMRAVYRDEAPAVQAAQASGWGHLRQGFTDLFPALFRLRTPIGAMALVALGFVSARFLMPAGSGPQPDGNMISSVRSVQPAPEGAPAGEVRIVLDETRRRTVSGSVNDGNIQRLLLTAAHDENNPGVRVESVDLLKSHSDSSEIRGLLLNRVVNDPNAGVRLKALDGLRQFSGDQEVRKVLAEVLLHDDNPGVRIQAVEDLTAHADDAMVGMLQNVVQKEDNGYVRRRCERALKDLNASVGTF